MPNVNQETRKWGPATAAIPDPAIAVTIKGREKLWKSKLDIELKITVTDPTKMLGQPILCYLLASSGQLTQPPAWLNGTETLAYWQPEPTAGLHTLSLSYMTGGNGNYTQAVHVQLP